MNATMNRRTLLSAAAAAVAAPLVPAAQQTQEPNPAMVSLLEGMLAPAVGNLAARSGTTRDIDALAVGFEGLWRMMQQSGHSLEMPARRPTPEAAAALFEVHRPKVLSLVPKLSESQYRQFALTAVSQVASGVGSHSFAEFRTEMQAALAHARLSVPSARLDSTSPLIIPAQSNMCWWGNWIVGYVTVALVPIEIVSAGAATIFGVGAWVVVTMYC